MTREENVKKLSSSYKAMKGQIECIDYEIDITKKECIEGLKELR